MTRTNKAYNALAAYYDSLMSGYNYDSALQWILRATEGKKRGVDLACGSGKITIALKLAGKDIFGVDNSPEMLNQAAINAKSSAQSITFVGGDLSSLELPKIDFATAMCDAVNYLTQKRGLNSFLKAVFNALKDGGILLFDVSSPYKLHRLVSGSPYYEDYDNLTLLWTNRRRAKLYKMELTFFVKEGECYSRFDECHEQRAYSARELRTALETAGFKDITMIDESSSKISARSKRYFISARKNG